MTMNNFCQSPVTTKTQGENRNAIFISERINTSDMLAETLKVLTLDSTINDSAYCHSDENDAEINSKSDLLVATHTSDRKKRKVTNTDTTNKNSQQILWINQTLPIVMPPIDLMVSDGVAAGRGTNHARQTTDSKVIVADVVHVLSRLLRT